MSDSGCWQEAAWSYVFPRGEIEFWALIACGAGLLQRRGALQRRAASCALDSLRSRCMTTAPRLRQRGSAMLWSRCDNAAVCSKRSCSLAASSWQGMKACLLDAELLGVP